MDLRTSWDQSSSLDSAGIYLFITIQRDARQNPIVQIMQLNWRGALKKEKKNT